MSENLSTGSTESSSEKESRLGTGTADSTATAGSVTVEELLAGHKTTVSVQFSARLLSMAQSIAAVRGVSANQVIEELLAEGVCGLIKDPQFRHLAERYIEQAQQRQASPGAVAVQGAPTACGVDRTTGSGSTIMRSLGRGADHDDSSLTDIT